MESREQTGRGQETGEAARDLESGGGLWTTQPAWFW
jgi:hypothetical protein